MSFIRRNRSLFIILGVAALLALWIASGVMLREPPRPPERVQPPPMSVAVEISRASPIERVLTLQGEVLPDQQVSIRAETPGRIESLAVERGSFVEAGTLIARIAEDDRPARIRQAEAAVTGRESDFRSAQRLAEGGFQAQLRVEMAAADLAAARAALEAARLDLQRTRIHAPIAGVVNAQPARVGSFVSVGDVVAEIVENDPLLAVAHVPQHQIRHVHAGAPASIRMIGDVAAEGRIAYVSAVADSATRTFRVEIALANPDRSLPAGVSAQVVIPLETVMAHRISPALVTLDDQGRIGVKAVADDDTVVFQPIEPVRADVQGIWVSGLPETLRLITVGQGFVNAGEHVTVVNHATDGDV